MAYKPVLIRNCDNNNLYAFGDSLGDPVWEPEPVTRFRLKSEHLRTNPWIQKHLEANRPTAGIIHNNAAFVGTSDGFVYGAGRKQQRIPDIAVDVELYIENFPFKNDAQRELFDQYRKENWGAFARVDRQSQDEVLTIAELVSEVETQECNLDKFLTGRISVKGFALAPNVEGKIRLYDGDNAGITDTMTSRRLHSKGVHACYQITPQTAGFVPERGSLQVKDGFETVVDNGMDITSLYSLDGGKLVVPDVCPRDGSGFAPAIFTTDGTTVAMVHGNHPSERLTIEQRSGDVVTTKVIPFVKGPRPSKLFIVDGAVMGDLGNTIRDYTNNKDVFTAEGDITSVSDSLLCTVAIGNNTEIHDPFSGKHLDTIAGDFEFLPSAPQHR